jgi:hypothetical protein
VLHRKLPQLRLTPHQHSSAPNSPRSPPILSPYTEEIPVVRGAFNVATTTLKPRRALLEEIARVLDESRVEYALVRTTFECAVGEKSSENFGGENSRSENSRGENSRSENSSSGNSSSEKEARDRGYFAEGFEDEDTTFGRLRFDIEVCRVSGLEMLLALRFRRVVGNQWEYQEICKNLMAKMKL